MLYLEAMEQCIRGDNNKIRCGLMEEGEYISYDTVEKRLLWWDSKHRCHWSYPADVNDEDYQKWIFDDWQVCNNIKPLA